MGDDNVFDTSNIFNALFWCFIAILGIRWIIQQISISGRVVKENHRDVSKSPVLTTKLNIQTHKIWEDVNKTHTFPSYNPQLTRALLDREMKLRDLSEREVKNRILFSHWGEVIDLEKLKRICIRDATKENIHPGNLWYGIILELLTDFKNICKDFDFSVIDSDKYFTFYDVHRIRVANNGYSSEVRLHGEEIWRETDMTYSDVIECLEIINRKSNFNTNVMLEKRIIKN